MDNKKMQVDSEILFYAFRYALGRSTYAPTTVIENIKHNIEKISVKDIEMYIKEIDDCNFYGMGIDETDWTEFKSYLESVLEEISRLVVHAKKLNNI